MSRGSSSPSSPEGCLHSVSSLSLLWQTHQWFLPPLPPTYSTPGSGFSLLAGSLPWEMQLYLQLTLEHLSVWSQRRGAVPSFRRVSALSCPLSPFRFSFCALSLPFPCTLGFYFLPLAHIISVASRAALAWKQDVCHRHSSWCKPNPAGSAGDIFSLASSPITYSQCSHWSAARSRCFTLKVSCVSSKTTLQSVLSRMLKTLLPTAGRFYLLQ